MESPASSNRLGYAARIFEGCQGQRYVRTRSSDLWSVLIDSMVAELGHRTWPFDKSYLA
jgi:hypothetical protein